MSIKSKFKMHASAEYTEQLAFVVYELGQFTGPNMSPPLNVSP